MIVGSAGMVPPFQIDGGLCVALVRGTVDAGLLSLFGGLLFRALVLPPALVRLTPDARDALQPALERAQLRLVLAGLLVSLVAGSVWLLLQSGAMAGGTGWATEWAHAWSAVPIVLRSTRFGHLLLLQGAGLVLLGLALLRRGRKLPLALSGLLVLLQAGHGHAMSMNDAPVLLLVCGIVHLLAGGAWLGGLAPLLMVVRIAPPRVAAMAARSFSVWGKGCVALVAATAAVQAWVLVGSIPAVTGTAYGWMACVKLVLFGVLLGFACLNRYRLAPALLRPEAEGARARLVLAIAVQSLAGLAILLAAGILADLPPGMRMDS